MAGRVRGDGTAPDHVAPLFVAAVVVVVVIGWAVWIIEWKTNLAVPCWTPEDKQ